MRNGVAGAQNTLDGLDERSSPVFFVSVGTKNFANVHISTPVSELFVVSFVCTAGCNVWRESSMKVTAASSMRIGAFISFAGDTRAPIPEWNRSKFFLQRGGRVRRGLVQECAAAARLRAEQSGGD